MNYVHIHIYYGIRAPFQDLYQTINNDSISMTYPNTVNIRPIVGHSLKFVPQLLKFLTNFLANTYVGFPIQIEVFLRKKCNIYMERPVTSVHLVSQIPSLYTFHHSI